MTTFKQSSVSATVIPDSYHTENIFKIFSSVVSLFLKAFIIQIRFKSGLSDLLI